MLLINLSVDWGMEMRVFKMATIKSVQLSIVDSIDIWKKIVETVLKKTTEQQIKKCNRRLKSLKRFALPFWTAFFNIFQESLKFHLLVFYIFENIRCY